MITVLHYFNPNSIFAVDRAYLLCKPSAFLNGSCERACCDFFMVWLSVGLMSICVCVCVRVFVCVVWGISICA